MQKDFVVSRERLRGIIGSRWKRSYRHSCAVAMEAIEIYFQPLRPPLRWFIRLFRSDPSKAILAAMVLLVLIFFGIPMLIQLFQ